MPRQDEPGGRRRPSRRREAPSAETDEQGTTPDHPIPWRIRGSLADRLEVALPVLGYVAATVSGLTTSSIGLLRQPLAGDVAGQLGTALPVRSDEWLTAAPIELATLANGSSMTTPLSNSPDLIYQVSSGSPFTSLLFADGNLLRLGHWLPDAMLFAAFRGFPWLLLMLTLPPLLRRMGATRSLSWLAVALCFLTPASAWWSFMPIRILAFAAAGSYVLVLARDRLTRRHLARGLLLSALAGLLLARLVTFYVPWSLTVGTPLVLATCAYLVWDGSRRRAALMAIGASAAVGVILLAAVFWEQWAALHAELNTVYPGQRRAGGAPMTPFALLGAPGLAGLKGAPPPVGTNQSEVSSAFLICGLVAAMLWPSVRRSLSTAHRAAYVALGGWVVLFVAWTTLSWGTIGEAIPGLNVVVPGRAAQTVGYPAAILMCLVVSAYSRTVVPGASPTDVGEHRRRALVIAAVAAGLTGYGVSSLRAVLPQLPYWQIWATVLLTGALVFVVVRYPRHWAPSVAVTLVALAISYNVNPVLFGLGEVRTSDAADRARHFRSEARAGDYRFAADSMFTDALLVANGVPMLNGYQVTGPIRDGWAEIDPQNQYEPIWNRGASYLLMSFDGAPGADPEVIEVQNDVIKIKTDPCWLAASSFDVERIVSGGPIKSPCARQVGEFTWYGAPQKVYALRER